MANVIFKKGLSTNLPSQITEGQILVETDTGVVHVDVAADKRLDLTSCGYGELGGTYSLFTVNVAGAKNQQGCCFITKLGLWLPPGGGNLSVNGQEAKPVAIQGTVGVPSSNTTFVGQYWFVIYDESLNDGNGAWNFLFTLPRTFNAGTGLDVFDDNTAYQLGQNITGFSYNIGEWVRAVEKEFPNGYTSDYILQGLILIEKLPYINGSRINDGVSESCLAYIAVTRDKVTGELIYSAKTLSSNMEPITACFQWNDYTDDPYFNDSSQAKQSLAFCFKPHTSGSWSHRFINLNPTNSMDTVKTWNTKPERLYESYYGPNWTDYIHFSDTFVLKEDNGSSIEWEEI